MISPLVAEAMTATRVALDTVAADTTLDNIDLLIVEASELRERVADWLADCPVIEHSTPSMVNFEARQVHTDARYLRTLLRRSYPGSPSVPAGIRTVYSRLDTLAALMA